MSKIQNPEKLYFRIGDVAELLGVKPYVLRYWETEFPMISPQKSPSGQRVYRRSDVDTVLMIKHLLYDEKYSIMGARKRISSLRKEGGLKSFKQDAAKQEPEGKISKLRDLATELQQLARTPISRLFHL